MIANCSAANGLLLMQRWTTTISITNGALPPLLVESNQSAISHGDNSPLPSHESLVANFDNSYIHDPNQTHFLVDHIAHRLSHQFSLLPFFSLQAKNETSGYAQNQKELGSALFLNLGIFICAFVVWAAVCPCIAALWRCMGARTRRRDSGNADTNSHEGDNSMDKIWSDAHADAPKSNYLLYLLVCMYTCCVLSLVNMCFLLPHGLVGKVLFGGWSMFNILGQINLSEVYLIILIDGLIILIFSELFLQLLEVPESSAASDRMRRTVWMQGLPTHDSVRWWRQFKLNELEIGRVRHDLMDALTDVLYVPPVNNGVPFGTKSQRSDSTVPASPPPLDWEATQWRCRLQGETPYYVNSLTGAAQWEMPMEVSTKNRPVETAVVEEMHVALVIDGWRRVHTELQQAREYLEAYEAKLRSAERDMADEQLPAAWRFIQRPASWWFRRRLAMLSPLIESLDRNLRDIRNEKKGIAGSAFITFKHPRHRDLLLQEEEDHPVSSWFWARTCTYFSFGRPPFASVTLACERAPHPSDVIWENLHITAGQRALVFWSLASLLLFVMVVLVTAVRISEFVVPIMEIVRTELGALEKMPIWQKFVPERVKKLVASLHHEVVWRSLFVQIPTLILLFINSVMVPAAITVIAGCQRTVKLSDAEVTRMMVNFFFLFTNTVVVPFCGVASLNELLGMLVKALSDQENPEPIKGLLFASPGMFALKYLMNATFISSANQLLQVPQLTLRLCQQMFLAVTDRDMKKYQEPWPFYWGYWYAWTLSIFALGINMSVACPSTLPIAALFFFVKYHVDKYNLDNGIYTCGTDIEGNMAVRVVYYLRLVVALWWCAMGALSYTIGVFEPTGNLDSDQKQWLRLGGIVLTVLGSTTFVWSWWLKAQHLLRILFHGFSRPLQPTMWDEIGEILHLKSTRRQGGEWSCSTALKAKWAKPLSWDGVALLGLE